MTASRAQHDLLDASAVQEFFRANRPEQVYIAAARVGGISANNTRPADFIWDNLVIEANLIKAAHDNDVQRLLFLGSSCIYPKFAEQPIREDSLLTGALEPTNEPYAIAKIAGIKLCESFNRQFGRDYRSVMPTNLYGPGDNFHPEYAHVIPALLRRFHEATQANANSVTIWGSGKPRREFLHVDDMAAASVHVMELEPRNVLVCRFTDDVPHQCGFGQGLHDCRVGPVGRRGDRLQRQHRIRSQQARWHSSEALGRKPAAIPWLECCHQPARRIEGRLRVVPRPSSRFPRTLNHARESCLPHDQLSVAFQNP